MASLPPRNCCTRSIRHGGKISGTMEKIDNIDVYFARPADNSVGNAIIICSNVFGIYHNCQLMADKYAKQGYLTVIPDLLKGDAISFETWNGNGNELQEWLYKHQPPSVDPIMKCVITYLRTTIGVQNLGGVGYCFGAKSIVRHLNDFGTLDAGYIAHPSWVTLEELKAVTRPLSIAAAENDEIFTQELRFDSEKILAELTIPYQINLYSGAEHGFSLASDLSVDHIWFATNQAFIQSLNWFVEFLKDVD